MTTVDVTKIELVAEDNATPALQAHRAVVLNLNEEYAKLSAATAAAAASNQKLAETEEQATKRIRDMVAASTADAEARRGTITSVARLSDALAANATTVRTGAGEYNKWMINQMGVAQSMRKTTTETVELSAATQKLMDKYDPLGTKLRSLQSDLARMQKEMGNSTSSAAMKTFQGLEQEIDSTRKLMEQAEGGAKKFSLASAGATRELVVLGHEAMTGNFSRMPGSFMVLAESMNMTNVLFSPMALGFAAITAAAGAAAVAVYQGHKEFVAIQNAIAVTSNFAGMTRESMNQLATQMTESKEITIGTANQIVLALTASGTIGSKAIGSIALSASDFAKSTGRDIKEVAPELVKLFSDPLKGAQELDKSMHFLKDTDLEYIATLQRKGNFEEAQLELSRKLTDHLPKQAKNVSNLEKEYNKLLDTASKYWDKFTRHMAGTPLKTDRVTELEEDRQRTADRANKGFMPRDQALAKIASINEELSGLQKVMAAENAATKAQQESTAAALRKTKAQDEVNNSQTHHIKILKDQLALVAEADDSKDKTRRTDEINKEIENTYRAMGAEGRALATESINQSLRLADVRLKAEQDRINGALQLGQINKTEFDQLMTLNALELNAYQINTEKKLASLSGLTKQERLSHNNKVQELTEMRQSLQEKGDIQKQVDEKKAYDDIVKSVVDLGYATNKQLSDAIDKQREHNAQIGKSAEQKEIEKKTIYDLTTAQKENDAAYLDSMLLRETMDEKSREIYTLRLQQIREEIALRQQFSAELTISGTKEADAKTKIDTDKLDTKKLEELDKYLDPHKAQSFGEALKEAFGQAGDGLAQMSNALRDYSQQQSKADEERQHALELYKAQKITLARLNADTYQIDKISDQQQINSFAQMTGAAKNFFNEGSRGYKAMHAAEQVFRATQLAMTIADTVSKLTSVTAVTTATVAGEEVKNTAVQGSVGIQLASDAVKGASAAAVGVATQASGEPYSAWARMAAMAATMAALGFAAFGGGGGGSSGGGKSAAEVQKEQGTGSVFGDANAKSDSISKSLETLKENSNILLPVNQSMLAALRNIEASMTGFTNLLIRTPGIVEGSNMGIATGVLSKTLGGILGSTTQNIVDSGIQYGGSLSGLQSGQGYSQYASVNTTSTGLFGWFGSTTNNVQSQALSKELSDQLGLVFKGLESTLKLAANSLGSTASDVEAVLNSLSITDTKVSLKGLSGTALTDALNAVISKTMDEIATVALPGLDAFRQVGEGYAQTAIRVASNIEVAGGELEKLGITAINFKDIVNKQGDVGAEIVRQSVVEVETMRQHYDAGATGATVYIEKITGVGQIMNSMSGTAAELAAAYKNLLDIRKQMTSVNLNGQDLNLSMIKGAGGTSELSTGLTDYSNYFFTESERIASQTKVLAGQFAQLGVAMPTTRDGFRHLIESTGTSTEASAKLTGQLLVLSDAFNTITTYADQQAQDQADRDKETADKATALANKKRDMEIRIMELEGNTVGALAARRQVELDSMDESLRGLQERTNRLLDEAEATKKAEDEAKKAAEVNKRHRDLEIQIMEAEGNTLGALTAKRLDSIIGMDAETVSLSQRLWAIQDANSAIEKAKKSAEEAATKAKQEADAAQQAWDNAKSAAESKLSAAYNRRKGELESLASSLDSFGQSARAAKESMIYGSSSTLGTEAKYLRAKDSLGSLEARAMSADATAIPELQQFIELSRAYNASNGVFVSEFDTVQAILDKSSKTALTQADYARAQLTALNDSVRGLIDLQEVTTDSAQSVVDAIKELTQVTRGNLTPTNSIASSINTTTAPTPDQIYGGKDGEGDIQQKRMSAIQKEAANVKRVQDYLDASYTAEMQSTNGYAPGNDFYNSLNEKYYGADAFQNAARQLGIFADPNLPTASQLPKFAQGGVFTNGIVSQPTTFSMGQMGEAGIEAIVPLTQGPRGLGITNYGGAGKDKESIELQKRQVAEAERNNDLLDQQNKLLEKLLASTDAGAGSDDIRKMSQTIITTVAKLVRAPA